MHPRSIPLPGALASLAAAVLLLSAGCATAPPSVDSMAVAPLGTVSTFHRISSGSFGTYNGKVVWTYSPTTWEGKPMVLFSAPGMVGSVHDPVSSAVVASVSADGKPLMSYEPVVDYAWPLAVGKTWSTEHTVTLHSTGARMRFTRTYGVEDRETITVPAGSLKAWKVSWKDSSGETETRWIAPELGIGTLKRHVERPAAHPQGAGVLDAELQSHVLPAR